MDFSIPSDIQDMLANVGQFLREEVYPLEERFVSGAFDSTARIAYHGLAP